MWIRLLFIIAIAFLACLVSTVTSFAFVPSTKKHGIIVTTARNGLANTKSKSSHQSSSSLQMVDQQVLMGAGIAFAGLATGIGLVAFTENQGERAKARGGGLSDDMSTRIAGGLMEDVEVSSVSDVGSLTSQLEAALKETGASEDLEFEMTEEELKKRKEAADDGW